MPDHLPYTLHLGDCLLVLKTFPDNSFDSVVTDPPYGLTTNKKGGTGVASVNLDSPYGRSRIGTGNGAGGFMGMKWDSDVPPVEVWTDSMGTIAGRSGPTNGAFSVADPRAPANALQYQQYGVRRWTDTSGAIIGVKSPGQGTYSVADPRGQSFGKYPVTDWDGPSGTVIAASTTGQGAFAVADPRPDVAWYKNVFRVVSMDQHAGTVTGGHSPSSGGQAVADPRYHNWHPGASSRKLHVGEWGSATGTVTGSQQVASGALSIADPRVLDRTKGDAYLTGGHYGVVGFDQSAGAVSASARHDNGRWSVADPRMPAANDRLTCIIQSLDGTWHRPFTTLELAALQSLVDPEEQLILDGLSDSDWRERIGNAVPPAAAEAIAGVMGTTLLLAEAGETFMLSNTPIWVRPVAVALSVAQQEVNP